MKIRPLPGPIGAEVLDADVRGLSDDEIKEIRSAWDQCHLLLFRKQDLSAEEQMDFAGHFGELGSIATKTADDAAVDRYVMDVTNVRLEGRKSYLPDGEMFFHFDTCYFEEPYSACFLYGIQVPAEGGETLYGNMIAAYEDLADEQKEYLAGRYAVNAYEYDAPKDQRKEPAPGSPSYEHPIVVAHPVTGERGLFVSRLMTISIVGEDATHSDEILTQLFDQTEDPRYTYRHAWQRGDLVIWDNRCVSHARTPFDPATPRHLRRVSVRGERPVAAIGITS